MFLVLFILESSSFSQDNSGVHQHESFFGRFMLGIANGKTVIEDVDGSDMEIEGSPLAVRIQLGGSISENLILYGDFGGISISDPDITHQGDVGTMENASMRVSDYGIGACYYFMPTNIFISGSVTMSSNKIEVEATDGQEAQVGESDTGFGFHIAAGKEWWVGDKWAIGGALFAQISNTKDKGPDENPISNRYFGINFSVTYD